MRLTRRGERLLVAGVMLLLFGSMLLGTYLTRTH